MLQIYKLNKYINYLSQLSKHKLLKYNNLLMR